jgi:ribosome-binding factor A
MSSQRVAKVESVIQQAVARALVELLERDAASVTVTRVDAAPDLRNATVWIGLLGAPKQQERLWARLEGLRPALQDAVAPKLTMKFVPVLHVRRDTGGEYAAEIDRLLRNV